MTALLILLGSIFIIIGGLMLLVATFRVSVWWGLAGLLIPFAQLVFIFKYWSESKSAIVTQTLGLLLVLAAVFTGGNTFTAEYKQQLNRYMQKIVPAQSQLGSALPSFTSPQDGMDIQQEAAVAPEPVGQKKIYKCVDAHGKVSYTEHGCVNGKENKVITIQNDIDPAPIDKAGDVFDKVKEVVMPDSETEH